ncbi:MAG: hypothetical protein SAK29_25745 [Scytonema sp. PMC 1069.18]|nr:hypothetical protein [Scytonema sp. PMC 1069.18]MEC4881466.1 hypothetical protein [Scytonema sp. PMC 1070.18]
MAIARKSDASATGGFPPTAQRKRINRRSVDQTKLSTHREIALRSRQLRTTGNALPTFSPPESAGKQRRLSKNSSLALPKPERALKSQTNFTGIEDRNQRAATIPVVPPADATPLWLLRLHSIHRNSSIISFLLVAVTLVVYGWTVYSQQIWSQSYRRLQHLQRHERQLMTTTEVLKNKMAQEAEKEPTQLVSPTPSGMIFLSPAPVAPNSGTDNTLSIPEVHQQSVNPVGY